MKCKQSFSLLGQSELSVYIYNIVIQAMFRQFLSWNSKQTSLDDKFVVKMPAVSLTGKNPQLFLSDSKTVLSTHSILKSNLSVHMHPLVSRFTQTSTQGSSAIQFAWGGGVQLQVWLSISPLNCQRKRYFILFYCSRHKYPLAAYLF